jgi:hypothetical protein
MKKLIAPALTLVLLATLALTPAAEGSWHVAIEQNPMLTNCGSTTNIPVAGATDCATATIAAWNLLNTLLQTPNCMNPGCPVGYTIGQGVSSCTPDPYTRPNGSPAMRWQVDWTWACVAPSCCNFHFDLSTGQGNGQQDPLWKVNGLPAYPTPPFPGWITTLTPARWLQPVASPTPSPNVPAGIYRYTVKFSVPNCPSGKVRLDAKFAADNTASVLLDGSPVPISACLLTCFKAPQAPVSLSVPAISPGSHMLEIDVVNNNGASGLVVNAHLTRQCP